MAGVLGIYGLIVAVILNGASECRRGCLSPVCTPWSVHGGDSVQGGEQPVELETRARL